MKKFSKLFLAIALVLKIRTIPKSRPAISPATRTRASPATVIKKAVLR